MSMSDESRHRLLILARAAMEESESTGEDIMMIINRKISDPNIDMSFINDLDQNDIAEMISEMLMQPIRDIWRECEIHKDNANSALRLATVSSMMHSDATAKLLALPSRDLIVGIIAHHTGADSDAVYGAADAICSEIDTALNATDLTQNHIATVLFDHSADASACINAADKVMSAVSSNETPLKVQDVVDIVTTEISTVDRNVCADIAEMIGRAQAANK